MHDMHTHPKHNDMHDMHTHPKHNDMHDMHTHPTHKTSRQKTRYPKDKTRTSNTYTNNTRYAHNHEMFTSAVMERKTRGHTCTYGQDALSSCRKTQDAVIGNNGRLHTTYRWTHAYTSGDGGRDTGDRERNRGANTHIETGCIWSLLHDARHHNGKNVTWHTIYIARHTRSSAVMERETQGHTRTHGHNDTRQAHTHTHTYTYTYMHMHR